MYRIHDMGGRYGDGAIATTQEEPPYKKDWHRLALGLTVASGACGYWNIDMSRRVRESLSPADYTNYEYYMIWVSAVADLLVEKQLVTIEELEAPENIQPKQLDQSALRYENVEHVLAKGSPTQRPLDNLPKYSLGQVVKTLSHSPARLPGGHTRLPRYAMGRLGKIVAHHHGHLLPDDNAYGQPNVEHLYTVAFTAEQIWGAHAENKEDVILLDLWESYLEPET